MMEYEKFEGTNKGNIKANMKGILEWGGGAPSRAEIFPA